MKNTMLNHLKPCYSAVLMKARYFFQERYYGAKQVRKWGITPRSVESCYIFGEEKSKVQQGIPVSVAEASCFEVGKETRSKEYRSLQARQRRYWL